MSFQEHTIKTEYRSLIDNVVQKFYVPLLKEAVSYKRAVGFFSSSSLIEISKGIADLASRDGRIQIVASPYLSDDDIEAIKKGYADRDEVIEAALLGQLSDEHTDYYSMERLNLLANLIAMVFWISELPTQRIPKASECTTKKWALSKMPPEIR